MQPLLLQTPIFSQDRLFGPQPGSAGPPAASEITDAEGTSNATPPAEEDRARLNPTDTVEISQEAEALLAAQLTEAEQQQVRQLQTRDREVRAHEQAHAAAAGAHARGGPTFDFQRGPDGRSYAVGGSVEIDTSPVPGDPDATIRKARTIRSAALAPADPSSQDRAVAAAASQMEAAARREIQQERQAEGQESAEPDGAPAESARAADPESTTAPSEAKASESSDSAPSDQETPPQKQSAAVSDFAARLGTLALPSGSHFDALA